MPVNDNSQPPPSSDDDDILFDGGPAASKPKLKLMLARRPETRALAERLLRDRLQWRHYRAAERLTVQSRTALLTLLALDAHGEAQGTLSLSSETAGISRNDALVAPSLRTSRSAVHPFVEITQLAVRSDPLGVPILAALFHTSVLYGRCRSATCCLLEVLTPDASFYRQVFGFAPVDALPEIPQRHPQTTLMGLRLAPTNGPQGRRQGPRGPTSTGELALRFFNAKTERDLFKRLVAQVSRNDK